MLKFNSFRAQRYLRSRFIEGKFLLASEASDIELELIDFCRVLIKNSLGDHAVEDSWKTELYRISTLVTNKVGNVLTLNTSLLDLVNIGDKVFKNGAFQTDITNVNVGAGTITVTSAAGISISDTIEILTTNSILIKPGDAWFEGLPFSMRGGKDHLVSGSQLAMGVRVVPGGGAPNITAQDDPDGRGKIVTFSDGGVTPTSDYQIVISSREEVITNQDDPFIKNANIPESTAQKLRSTFRINVVPTSVQESMPIPYTDTNVAGNLTNYIDVIPQNLGNGSEVSRTVLSGSEQIDGRNLEIIIRNNPASANPSYSGSPVGNPIPTGSSEQSEFSNGRFVDSLGREYHLNAIFNDTVANQVVIRIDKEVDQEDPAIVVGSPYRLYKRDSFVTDDTNGTPQGQLFWPVANVAWSSVDGFVHDSVVEDLRREIEALQEHEEKTTVKFNLRLLGGGTATAEPTVKASGTVTVIDNTFDALDAIVINGVSFVYNVDWLAGGSPTSTATNIADAINTSTDPSIENVVTATSLGATVTITAVVGGTAGNSIPLAEVDGATDNFTLSGAFLAGGVDGTPGELTWDADFKIVNPHGLVQLILAGEAVLREGGALAYLMDLENGGTVSKGELAVTTTSTGTNITLSGSPDLSQVKVGNTLLVGQTSTSIVAIDDVNKELEVFPSLGVMGAGTIYLDTYAQGTLPKDPNTFVLAVKTGNIIQVTGRGELEQGESTTSGIPIQLLQYIGSTSETDNFPQYFSNDVVNDGDNLTTAVGKLDEAAGDLSTYVGSPDPNDTTPDYSNEYAITDGDSLTVAAGKLDAAQQASDEYSGKPTALDNTPDYSSTDIVTDGDDLTEAIGDLDLATSDLADYVGAPLNDTTPDYSSSTYVTDGDDLTTAIGDLDAALTTTDSDVADLRDRSNQDRNAKLIKGGTWSWDLLTDTLSWSANAFVEIAGLANTVNQIDTGSAVLAADDEVAYVTINRVGPGGSIGVTVADIALVPTTDDIVIIARRVGTDVLVGHTFLLKDKEYLELDGALAEINRRLNQLRLTPHETSLLKARVAASDIAQLDGTTLIQELSEFVMDFGGAVINFTTGVILEEDDATPLGLNFTPFSVPVGEYFWYGVGLLPLTVGPDNRMSAQVQVTPASVSNAVAGSAPYPNILGDKKLGAIQVFNNAGTIEVFAIRRLGVGSGSGSGGAGDTTELVETIKNTLNDSFYSLAAHTVFQTDEEDLVDPASTGSFSLVSKTFEMATGELLLTDPLLDQAEFLDLARDVSQVDISVFWDLLNIDDAATVEISRDNGAHWSEVEMERVGEASASFHGTHEFEEEKDPYSDSFATTTNTLELTNEAGVRDALAQRFVLTEETEVSSVTLQMSKLGAVAGQYRLLLVASSSSQPNTSNVEAASAWANVSGLSTSAAAVVLTVNKTLVPATYHVVVETDAAYKAAFSAGVVSARLHGDTATGDGSASALDVGTWAAIATTTFAYDVDGFIESFDSIVSQASTDVDRDLDATNQQKISQSFTLVDTNIIKEVTIFLTKTGTPTGRLYASIVRDDAGAPSSDPADTIIGTTGVDITTLVTGANRLQLPVTPIAAGTYHLVFETDAAYKAVYSNGVTEISLHALDAGTGAQFYNGTIWSLANDALKYTLSGRPLEVLLRITASQDSALEGFAVYYDLVSSQVTTASKNLEIHQFNATDNLNEFTLTTFVPDPDSLNVHYVQSGQTFRYGAFELHGNTVVFPEDSFDNGGIPAAISLVFEQTQGGGFDNADVNARLLADNYLGSADASLDRSVPGRGIKLRRPDGTLREIGIDDSDNLVIYSV